MDDTSLYLDRYELRERLGRGGMATVYRAYDRNLERTVALKLFAPGTATDDARRRAEATLLGRLSHPNLVTLHDAHLAAEGDTTPSLLVMELVAGEDLRTRLERGPLPAEDAAVVAESIAEALAVVHGAGMVHRDLKPANILLADSGIPGGRPIVKLADFGIAHLLGTERLTTAGTVIGTAGYLSPEQGLGGEPGPSADIYALGLVVLESLTGVREYPGSPVEAVSARAARDPRIPASLPEDWRGLLGAMTTREPGIRPTAVEVAIMARELAPQLAGWEPEPATTVPAGTVPTVAMTAIGGAAAGAAVGRAAAADAAGATGPTAAVRDRGVTRSRRRRHTLDAVLVTSAAAAVVGLAFSLGSILSPGPIPASGDTTPRPTPSVVAPPATVAPADTPAQPSDQQQTDQQQQQQQQQQPQPKPQQDNPNKGPGKNNGNGKGKGKGGG
ncbi:serine/threonine-protein kinase [Leifsonia sp. NPDC080035]|uniref:non-specific serine/threonine protein kinase n=1 Tax=Leifsonia sp. NPDC080035 TaxID=3143936 RepID=A0AAU7GGP9_9MICO